MARLQQLEPEDVKTRATEARRYLDVAQLMATESDVASWKVAGANAVSSGIAAADAICGMVLGYCSKSPNHADAVKLLERAVAPDKGPVNNLRRLVGEKSLFHYGSSRVTLAATTDLVKYAERLVGEMDRRVR